MRAGEFEVEGLAYHPEAIAVEEAADLITLFESFTLEEIRMRGA